MNLFPRILSIACLTLIPLTNLRGAEREATPPSAITTHPGFKVELLRSAQPEEGSWISMTFDSQGRVILAEDRGGLLRITLGKTPEETRFEKLTGTEHLKHCRGVLWAFDSLYVCATDGGGLYRLRDLDGDDQFEECKLIIPLQYNSRYGHGANQIRLGPDGMLYLVIGNDVQFPEMFDPKSPYRHHANDWMLPNPHDEGQDQRVGYILRFDAEGNQRTILAGGFRNQIDVSFNLDGEMFTWDADMEWDVGLPWYRPTRFNHVVSGGEYGWRWGTGKWAAWFPDSLPSTLDTGLGSPTGVTFGTTSNWPQRFQQALFAADWQHGRILIVDLIPSGASYRGEAKVFADGSPLNVSDLEFGPDGALYFITGGRGSQSGLYRLTCPNPEVALKHSPPPSGLERIQEEARSARQLRHQLEKLHVEIDPAQLDFIWANLANDDPWIRFAARVALENQPLDHWRKRVATEPDSPARHHALMALARVGTAGDQKIVIKGLKEWNWTDLPEEELILALRTFQLTLIRQGPLDPPNVPGMMRKLHQIQPSEDFRVNRLYSELLVSTKSPEAISRILTMLEAAVTQEEQIQYAKTLARIEQRWPLEQRKMFLTWLSTHRGFPGGKLMQPTLTQLRQDVLSQMTAGEQTQFAELVAKLEGDGGAASEHSPLLPTRAFVRKWTMEDLDSDLVTLRPQDRSMEQGRTVLAAASCLRCHQFGERGGQFGPNLTAIGKRFDGRALLESILVPSKEIDPKYFLAQYELEDGRIVTGRAISVSRDKLGVETDPLTGASISFARKEIIQSKNSTLSPMPEGLLDTFTKEEILDLIAYLRAVQ